MHPKRDTKPQLGFPVAVRLIARPAPSHPLRRRSPIIPQWQIRAVVRVGKHVGPGPRANTGVPITEPLDILVFAPAGTVDLRVGYVVVPDRITCASCWGPVTLVDDERHDPTKRWYSPNRHPTIHHWNWTNEQASPVPEPTGDVPAAATEPPRDPAGQGD